MRYCGEDPFSGHVFCFFNRRRDRAKLLVWERGGFWLLYKRLEEGTFGVPGTAEINGRELFLLLEGIEVVRERRRWAGPRKVEKTGKMASKVVLSHVDTTDTLMI